MAKDNTQNSAQAINQSFTKGLNKDSDPSYVQEGMWTHARNVTNNTISGDLGTVSNETSNFLCAIVGNNMPITVTAKYIVGLIQLFSDKWLVYTAGHGAEGNPIMSEIGLLEEDRCIYRPIVLDACLNFDKRHLITGASREKEDCSWQAYWADGLNPDRYINVGDPKTWPDYDAIFLNNEYVYPNGHKELWPNVAWNEDCNQITDCTDNSPLCLECAQINTLNCDQLRLARLMETPCLKLSLGNQGGNLRNGSYFAVIAYTINGQKVTDFFSPSNTQPIWTSNNTEGSLEIEVEADTVNFDEFLLVIVENISGSAVAKQIGFYSTKTTSIALDQIKEDLISFPLQLIPIQNPVFEKSDQISEVNDYLLRVGPTSRFDFNYQPLANQIKTKWASVEYPGTYYLNGGNKPSYLRDEVYAFFIRWVYNTGDKSASYHIPGRAPRKFIDPETGATYKEDEIIHVTDSLYDDDRVFEVYNTASITTIPATLNQFTDDGGKVIAVGDMGYWQSTEVYPTTQPEVWNASCHCWTGTDPQISDIYDLCGLPIRHHKFPDNYLDQNTVHFKKNPAVSTNPNDTRIRIMGVYFDDITYPKDNDGKDIPGIVGYEILRGSREGNRSVIAKGIVNNFRSYNIRGTSAGGRQGLYANYPFNSIIPYFNSTTDATNHAYQFNDPFFKLIDPKDPDVVKNQSMPKDVITFHSPDTMFRTPFLSTTEIKLYGYLRGASNQRFIEPNKHPRFKLLSDAALIPAFLTGLIEAALSLLGTRTYNTPKVDAINPALYLPNTPPVPSATTVTTAATTYDTAINGYYNNGGFLLEALNNINPFPTPTPGDIITEAYELALSTNAAAGVIAPWNTTWNVTEPGWAYLDPVSRALYGISQFAFYFVEGVDVALKIIQASIPYTQYALQMISHGFYNDMQPEPKYFLDYLGNQNKVAKRFKLEDRLYIRDNVQELPYYQNQVGSAFNYSINNLQRQSTVTLRTKTGPYYDLNYSNGVNTGPEFITSNGKYIDQSLTTLGHIQQEGLVNVNTFNTYSIAGVDAPTFDDNNVDIPFAMPIASHYAAIKNRIRNQYGQLGSIKQVVVTPCEQKFDYADIVPSSYACNMTNYSIRKLDLSPLFFNGDTYINRYTEKNNMFFFFNWLYNLPDGTEFNYLLYQTIQQPRFFANSSSFDSSDLKPSPGNPTVPGTGHKPSDFYSLDFYVDQDRYYNYTDDTIQKNALGDGYAGFFRVKEAYFYLASSSVKDFFVESDVIIDFREAGDYEWEKHYDPYRYTDLNKMFEMDPNAIVEDNVYRYDYSLSISKLFAQYLSAGNLQSRYYNPAISQLCYTYYPDRIYYSLQQQMQAFKDSWLVFLPNNYREFKSQISGVKPINKNGIIITFRNDGPMMFQGVDTLQTNLGTKITIGDGGLFTQPSQSVSNADKPYEYGSSQNRLSVISTPAGIFYMSQNQGKIFSYGDGLKEVSQSGMKWWFNNFLPYKLTDDFPEYPYQDNPVAGIGCQSLYDNDNTIVYFCKKDYQLKPELKGKVTYVPIDSKRKKDYFTLADIPNSRFLLGDPTIFDDASWTISYDPKNDFFISFHDWHPDLTLSAKNTFLTTHFNGIWKHNTVCDNYCNFYGINYPFEIEMPVITGSTVTTLKSVEYILECYRRSQLNCVDQHHVLDFNFDRVVVYNTEQVSGYLNLNLFPKNNVTLSQTYPKLNQSNLASFDILFSKEENKYRFNQFWDITKDRAEFPINSDYPPTGPVIPGTTILNGNYSSQNIWITAPNGYDKILNPANLDYNKPQLQRKKFRHYLNFLNLRRDISGNINMILKLTSTKNQISLR
jgi:hypothetical protein